MRIVLIPLFVKQIHASRGMQALSPELQAIQKKYKGKSDPASREAMSRETMALYRKHGTNPFASCLPILAQAPIFFALFRVLNNGIRTGTAMGALTTDLAHSAQKATFLGAPLSGTFLGSDLTSVRVVTALLIVAMSVTTFTTQRQLTQKNMPASALQGPMAQNQKIMLYAMPLMFAFSGVNFPIGVLVYWTTTNLWSMGQQFYTIRRMPTPGSEAEKLMKERRARKGITPAADAAAAAPEPPKPSGQRQQPKRKDRAKGKTASSGTEPGPGASTGDDSAPGFDPSAGVAPA
jgi:YidC/Oxa1 family membrane protein insertase